MKQNQKHAKRTVINKQHTYMREDVNFLSELKGCFLKLSGNIH